MSRIVVTAITQRSLANWLPAILELQNRGHRVRTILFPHRPDPDSKSLELCPLTSIGNLPIYEHLSTAQTNTLGALIEGAARLIDSEKPDLLLQTTCHAGPELGLAQRLRSQSVRPLIVGCQHGFVQNWDQYWNKFALDYLLVFGEHFQRLAPPNLKARVLVAGLPKLDLIKPVAAPEFDQDMRPILFAAQTHFSAKIEQLLYRLQAVSGRNVCIRPHPEFRDIFKDLAGKLDFWSVEEPLNGQLQRASLLLTTGSTVALEALVAGLPVVVLPEQGGQAYASAGIVAQTLAPAEIIELASAFGRPETATRRRQYLLNVTGSADRDRVKLCSDRIEQMLA